MGVHADAVQVIEMVCLRAGRDACGLRSSRSSPGPLQVLPFECSGMRGRATGPPPANFCGPDLLV